MGYNDDTTFERHYTIKELVAQWGVGRETIRRLVETYPGVVRIKMGDRQRNNAYRIPESVARMIHEELTIA